MVNEFKKGDKVQVVDAPGYDDFEAYFLIDHYDNAVVVDDDDHFAVVPIESLEKL